MRLENADLKFWRLRNPVAWGVGFSLLLLLALVCIFRLQDCVDGVCQNKWQKLLASSPNEIGDTLAGVAGALAFLWIIVTVWLQSQELREQRKEMQLQRKEFKKMVKAQKAQVRALKAQADIFEDERKQRSEVRSDELINALLEEFIQLLEEVEKDQFFWEYVEANSRATPLSELFNEGTRFFFPREHRIIDDFSEDEVIHQILNPLKEQYGEIKQSIKKNKIKEFPSTINLFEKLASPLFKMKEIAPSCSEAMQTRIRMMTLIELAELFEKICEDDSLWGIDETDNVNSLPGVET